VDALSFRQKAAGRARCAGPTPCHLQALSAALRRSLRLVFDMKEQDHRPHAPMDIALSKAFTWQMPDELHDRSEMPQSCSDEQAGRVLNLYFLSEQFIDHCPR